MSEIEEYRNIWGVSHVYLADQYVDGADLERAAAEILYRGLQVSFHVMGRPEEGYTRRRAEELFRAGCRWISWGVESGSQRLLELINKKTYVPIIEGALKASAASGISNLIMMIFGLPTSTEVDLMHTFRFLEGVYDSIESMSNSSFVLWDGTDFARNASLYGMHIVRARELLRADGRPVHSHRIEYLEVSADGSLRPPRGPVELAEWEGRRRWLGENAFLERLPCEHYLLYAAKRRQS